VQGKIKDMTTKFAANTKKFIAVGGLAVGLVGLGLFADATNAAADPTAPDTGSYDEQTDLAQEGCWGGINFPEGGSPSTAGCTHTRLSGSYGLNGG
jgi:hypothetical protein